MTEERFVRHLEKRERELFDLLKGFLNTLPPTAKQEPPIGIPEITEEWANRWLPGGWSRFHHNHYLGSGRMHTEHHSMHDWLLKDSTLARYAYLDPLGKKRVDARVGDVWLGMSDGEYGRFYRAWALVGGAYTAFLYPGWYGLELEVPGQPVEVRTRPAWWTGQDERRLGHLVPANWNWHSRLQEPPPTREQFMGEQPAPDPDPEPGPDPTPDPPDETDERTPAEVAAAFRELAEGDWFFVTRYNDTYTVSPTDSFLDLFEALIEPAARIYRTTREFEDHGEELFEPTKEAIDLVLKFLGQDPEEM